MCVSTLSWGGACRDGLLFPAVPGVCCAKVARPSPWTSSTGPGARRGAEAWPPPRRATGTAGNGSGSWPWRPLTSTRWVLKAPRGAGRARAGPPCHLTLTVSPQDPYFMKNHLGSYECKLCLTLHNNEVRAQLAGVQSCWPGQGGHRAGGQGSGEHRAASRGRACSTGLLAPPEPSSSHTGQLPGPHAREETSD